MMQICLVKWHTSMKQKERGKKERNNIMICWKEQFLEACFTVSYQAIMHLIQYFISTEQEDPFIRVFVWSEYEIRINRNISVIVKKTEEVMANFTQKEVFSHFSFTALCLCSFPAVSSLPCKQPFPSTIQLSS